MCIRYVLDSAACVNAVMPHDEGPPSSIQPIVGGCSKHSSNSESRVSAQLQCIWYKYATPAYKMSRVYVLVVPAWWHQLALAHLHVGLVLWADFVPPASFHILHNKLQLDLEREIKQLS